MNYTATTPKNVDPAEEKKRAFIFTKKRTKVLIKVFGADPIPGLLEKARVEMITEVLHTVDAKERGLNPEAYRPGRSDSGYCLFQKEQGIRITNLIAQLKAAGLKYVGGHWQTVMGKKCPVQFFQFSLDGEEQAIPQAITDLLTSRFGEVSVWLNPQRNGEQPGQFRIDTVNLNNPHASSKPARELVVEGNTYRLNPVP